MPEAKILVVEDNDFMRRLLEMRLKANHYDVVAASDGLEGLEKAKENPDVIILDINLPNLSGLEVAAQLKGNAKTKTIPIIFVTAKGEDKDVFRAITELGAECYILKPFQPEKLLDEIQKALNKKRK